MANEQNIILEVKNLKKYFKVGSRDILKAVDDVSFAIKEGETLGLVGESGCGKTTCGRTAIGMYDKTAGEVIYKGKPISKFKGKEKKQFNKDVQIIFQDPYASLNPRMTVSDIISSFTSCVARIIPFISFVAYVTLLNPFVPCCFTYD